MSCNKLSLYHRKCGLDLVTSAHGCVGVCVCVCVLEERVVIDGMSGVELSCRESFLLLEEHAIDQLYLISVL